MRKVISLLNPQDFTLWKVLTPSWNKGTSPITVIFVSLTSVMYKMLKWSSFIIFIYQSGGKCGRILIQRLKTLLRWCRLHEIKGTSPITSRSMTPLIHLLWWSFKLYVLLCAFKPNKIWIFKTLSQFFISTIINNKNMWKPNLITIENCWTSKQCGTI